MTIFLDSYGHQQLSIMKGLYEQVIDSCSSDTTSNTCCIATFYKSD